MGAWVKGSYGDMYGMTSPDFGLVELFDSLHSWMGSQAEFVVGVGVIRLVKLFDDLCGVVLIRESHLHRGNTSNLIIIYTSVDNTLYVYAEASATLNYIFY